MTKAVNKRNEEGFSAKAQQQGGRLKALKGAPPVLAPKSAKTHIDDGATTVQAEQPEADMQQD